MKILLVAVNSKYIHSCPAVHILKEYTCPEDHDTVIKEYTINMNRETVLSSVISEKPDIIAFSCYIWNISYIRLLISDFAKILPSAEIWLGGPEVSFHAEQFLLESQQVRGIMTGEGENAFDNLYKYWNNGNPLLSDIPGLVYRDKNKIINTGTAAPLNVDTLPFWQKNISELKNRIIYYESSRGCPFSCSYCMSADNHPVRFRNIKTVLNEIGFFIKNRVPQVKFTDRTFNCSRERSLAILNFIKDNDNGITNFHFEIAADIMSEEEISVLGKLRPGQVQLEIGVQSSNTEALSAVNRHADLKKLENNVVRIRKNGNIHIHLDLIAGLPYEDIDSFRKSFAFVYAMHPHQFQLGFLKVLKGAPAESAAEKFGITYSDNPPYQVLSTAWLSYTDISELKNIEEMTEMFYNSRQFSYTVSALEQLYDNPYFLYLELYRYIKETEQEYCTPSRIHKYEILYEFASQKDSANSDRYAELLTFDAYLRENCRKRPSFAAAPDAYRNSIFTGKETNRHIEAFRYPVWAPETVLTAQKRACPVFIEFRYSVRNPIDGNFLFSTIRPE